jgi:hypothetical protein
VNCLGVQQRQQLVFSCTQENELHIFGLLRSAGRRPSCDPRILLLTVSVLNNEENWDARVVERFSLPLYGTVPNKPPPPKISVMPQRKHCLGSATPQRNIVFLISPTRAHACLISCSGRKKIHSRCYLPINNQSACALVQQAVRHFFRRVKKTSVLELDPSSPQRMASRGSVRATVSFA